MKFLDVAKKYLKDKGEIEITLDYWPSEFYFDSDTVGQFKRLESYTNKEGVFSKQNGPVGWEYALNIYYLIDKLYFSNFISGNYSSVNVSHSAKVIPEYTDNNQKVRFEIRLGDKKITTSTYKTEEIKDKFKFGLFAIFHTHPKFYHQDKSFQYSFFSSADLMALLNSSAPIIGLIAGRFIWLACKTDQSRMIPNDLLMTASRVEHSDGNDKLKEYIMSDLNQYGIVFYGGSFGSKLKRI